MATSKKNVYYYEYYSSIKFVFNVPEDPSDDIDIVSETATVKEVPGLTWFLRVEGKADYRNQHLLSDLVLTLTPSPGITPANLSYSVEGLVEDNCDFQRSVSQDFQAFKPFSSSETTSQILLLLELPKSKKSSKHHMHIKYLHGQDYRLDSISFKDRTNFSCTVKLTVRSPENLFPPGIVNLLNDIASPKLADFTIRVGGSEYKSHKHILSARSPVFCAMFSNANCAEVQNSEMTVTDATKNALEMFLKFLYTASMPVLELSLYMEVLVLAEKYQVMELKKLCELKIAEKMTIQDPIHEIYRLAFTYNFSLEFQTKCFDLVKEKFFRDKYINPEMVKEPEKVLKLVNILIEFDETLSQFNTSVVSSAQLRKTRKRKVDKS